ncbi:hypothetical protein LTR08_007851 [Meristemomyces frigidus]|nr:hypothetical protein LTR08_007851 [Meristemomyces frigidus]
MARKRAAAEMEMPSRPRPHRAEAKRTKLSTLDVARSNSSAPSSCSVSEASALQSSPAASDRSRHSSASSMHPDVDDGSESSVSSSSDESSEEASEDEERVVPVGGPKKPEIADDGMLVGAHDFKARLSAFLPRLAAANSELDKDGAGHSMEDVEDGEQHIEMNLGLGVLEEKQAGDSSSSDESSDCDSEDADDEDVPVSSDVVKREKEDRDTQVMDKLLGQKRGRRKGGVEEMG